MDAPTNPPTPCPQPTKRAARHDTGGRRFFIPVGVSNPGAPFRPLHASADVAQLSEVFVDSFGYRRVGIDDDPSFGELRAALVAWLGEASLTAADDVVVYYSGHGHLDETGVLYLCTRGFSVHEPANALRADGLVELILGRDARPGKLWLILDCCHAGGALDGELFERVCRRLRGAYVLAASSTYGLARDGAFGEAFAHAARLPRSRRSLASFASAVQDGLGEGGQRVGCFEIGPAEFDFLVDRGTVSPPAPVEPHRRRTHAAAAPVANAPPVAPVREGDVVDGKYRVGRVLGAGGMGVVVAATHLQLEQTYALKFLLPEIAMHAELVTRFFREARAAARIRSEHVSRVMDVGLHEGRVPFMVMELLEGEDVANALARRRRLPVAEVADIVLQACEALAEAHDLGIVHRDLKPSNLFIAQRAGGKAIVKVLDFGISRMPAAEPGLTRTSAMVGTVHYMSPEQTRSSAVDARSDIWALGVILYELLTGTLPFEGEAIGLVVGRILTATPPSPRERCPEIPPDVEAAIQRCLRRAPEERFPTVAALAEALEPFATSRSTRRAPVEPMFQPRASPPPGNTPIALASAASTGTRRSPIAGRVARVALALGLACALVAAGARWLRPLAASPPTVVAPGPSPPAASTLPSAGDAATTSPSASAAETHAGPRPSPLPRPAAAHPSASSPRCADLLERLGLGDELGPDERAFFDQECKR